MLSWWCLWYTWYMMLCGGGRNRLYNSVVPADYPGRGCCCHLVIALPLNSRGTHCCMHPWQTVGPLATNGFFITSRSCQQKELLAQQRRYLCGQVLWSHRVCQRSAVVSLPPSHVQMTAVPHHRAFDLLPTATSASLSVVQSRAPYL